MTCREIKKKKRKQEQKQNIYLEVQSNKRNTTKNQDTFVDVYSFVLYGSDNVLYVKKISKKEK